MTDYSHWINKQHTKENISSYIEYFDKHKSLFKIKEIEKYNIDSLKDAISSVDRSRTSRHLSGLDNNDYHIAFEDNDVSIVRCNTLKASRVLSRGTKWCINSNDPSPFIKECEKGYIIYVILKKFPKRNSNLNKIAVVISGGYSVYFDQEDQHITDSKPYLLEIAEDFDNIDFNQINDIIAAYYNSKKFIDSDNIFLKKVALSRTFDSKALLKAIDSGNNEIRRVCVCNLPNTHLYKFVNDPDSDIRKYVSKHIPLNKLNLLINDPSSDVRIAVANRIPIKYAHLMLGDTDRNVIYIISRKLRGNKLYSLYNYHCDFVRSIVAKGANRVTIEKMLMDDSYIVWNALSERLSTLNLNNSEYISKIYHLSSDIGRVFLDRMMICI